jgi:hypothetical protein
MSESPSKFQKAMTPDQFTQVVDAILEGKYSWACVLILRFAGYNPLHYIPYRTYNRLMKENQPTRRHRSVTPDPNAPERLYKIEDLGCLEVLNDSHLAHHQVKGGNHLFWHSIYYADYEVS